MNSPKKISSQILSVLNNEIKNKFIPSKLNSDSQAIKENRVVIYNTLLSCTCQLKSNSTSCAAFRSTCTCVGDCSTHTVNGVLLPSCTSYTYEDAQNLIKANIKMNTIKTVALELRQKILEMTKTIHTVYDPVRSTTDIIAKGNYYLKNFKSTTGIFYENAVERPYLESQISEIIDKRPIEPNAKITGINFINMLNALEKIKTYCPCNSNTFSATGGCTGKVDCPTHTYSSCTGFGGCSCYDMVFGCGSDTWCTCHSNWVCHCVSKCSLNTCPCDCFGYIT